MPRTARIQMAQDRMISWPSAAVPVTLTSATTTFTWGSWVQLVASTSAPSMIVGCEGFLPGATISGGQVQIGTGGAGSEVAAITVPVYCGSSESLCVVLPVGVFVTSGTRVAARWADGENASTFNITNFRAVAVSL